MGEVTVCNYANAFDREGTVPIVPTSAGSVTDG